MKKQYISDYSKPYIDQLKELIQNNPRGYYMTLENAKEREIKDLANWINEQTPLLQNKKYRWSTKCYWILNNLTDFPKCDTCGKSILINVISISKGYNKTCSQKCSGCNEQRILKVKSTCLNKYGNENYTNVQKHQQTRHQHLKEDPLFQEKINRKTRATKLLRYGSETFNNRQKCKETNIRRYGYECNFSDPACKEKIAQTNLKLYGAKNVFQSEQIKQKIKKTNLERRGVEYTLQDPSIREQIKKTNFKQYGYEEIGSVPLIRDKIHKTNLEKYGYEEIFSDPDIQEKSRETCLEKFGYEYPNSNPDVQHIRKQQLFELSGVTNVFQLNEVKLKIRQTCLNKYGVTHPSQVPEIQRKIISGKYIFNNIKFDTLPELAFYIYLKDFKVNFEYHNSDYWFDYEFNNKIYRYFPDFKIGTIFFEIKGDQFFENKDQNNKMICPYHNKSWTDERYQLECQKYEAKHQCMLKNSVVILTSVKYSKYLNYINAKYGKNYLKQFRIKHED